MRTSLCPSVVTFYPARQALTGHDCWLRERNGSRISSQTSPASTPNITVVAGDLNTTSSITSEGDICVMGRLSGLAHAGSNGDRNAVIRALSLDSKAIKIADVKIDRHVHLEQETLITCNASGKLELRPQQTQSEQLREGGNRGKLAGKRGSKTSTQIQQIYRSAVQTISDASLPAKAALITGAYILVAGLLLFFAPVSCFTLLFDQRSVAPVWIRVGGVLASLFGFYYLGAAHGDLTSQGLRSFYRSTVYGRLFLVIAFTGLVVTGKSQWQLLILAAVNLLGAGSMHQALKKQSWQQEEDE